MNRARRSMAWITLLAFLLPATGCVQTRIRKHRTDQEPALSVDYHVFAMPKDRKEGGPHVPGVLSELYLLGEDGWYLVYRSQEGQWNLADLPPGRYRIVTDRRYNPETGEVQAMRGDTEQTFRLKPGERVEIKVVLKKTPVGLIVALSITVVALIVVAVVLAESGDMDFWVPDPSDLIIPPSALIPPVFIPPLPDPFHLAHPPIWGGIWIDPGPVYIPASPRIELDDERAPIIDQYTPQDGTEGVPLDSAVRLRFNQAMDGRGFDPRNVLLETEDGPVPAGLRYDRRHRTLIVRPLKPMPAGRQITATVFAEGLESTEGTAMELNYRWSFSTAP